MKLKHLLLSLPLLALAGTAHAASCGGLAGTALPHGTITAAAEVAAGKVAGLPAFCEVHATLRPAPDSEIHILVWLPLNGWDGKLVESGNGAFDPAFTTGAMAQSLAAGFAATSSDTGHTENSAGFALGHPQKLIDFGYRAVHENAVAAKAIAARFYGRPVRKAYFIGCSTGGRQAYGEAQRYPTDFDGIVAGDPGIGFTHQTGAELAHIRYIHDHPDSLISPAKLAMLHAAVIAACDTIDGVKDGVIENPLRCTWKPESLACKGADAPDCLTEAQVALVNRFYRGLVAADGTQLFPGYPRGAEAGWGLALIRAEPLEYGLDAYRLVALQDPSWNFPKFEPDRDIALADAKVGAILNNDSPDLRAFFAHGGKLIGYHGFADPMTTPMSSIAYFRKVAAFSGGQQAIDQSYRLFMIPGMAHCTGGDGTDCFSMLGAIDHWVESGHAPDSIPAARKEGDRVIRTRPLCPFPQEAIYQGQGSTDDAASFHCGTV
jgi:feruloyl esterase